MAKIGYAVHLQSIFTVTNTATCHLHLRDTGTPGLPALPLSFSLLSLS